jgi:hypothetical protein
MATNWIFTGKDQDAPTLFAKVSSKLLEAKISCDKTNQKEPDLTAMFAANSAKLNIWNDDLESITDMKDWNKILDQPTIFGTNLQSVKGNRSKNFSSSLYLITILVIFVQVKLHYSHS